MDDRHTDDLRRAYDAAAAERDARDVAPWKLAEMARFAERLRAEGRRDLLEIGAGPGRHARHFHDLGFAVTPTDLSPEMARLARDKGLPARVMDFRRLDFPPASFDAVWSFNCLLHTPPADLPGVLAGISRVLRPDGLFYYGVYGGNPFEGIWPDDRHSPPRYFVFYTDDELQRRVRDQFDVVDFRAVALEGLADGDHFQALTLRRRGRA